MLSNGHYKPQKKQKMRTLKLTTLLLALTLVFGSTSCKYEDGPNLSLRTKKARIAGDWIIEKTIDSDGTETAVKEANSPVTTIEKDGTVKTVYTVAGVSTTVSGTWEFTDSKKKIKFTNDGNSNTEEILRLTNKEFWIKDTDGDKTYYKAK